MFFFFEADKTIIKNYHEKDAQHKKYGKMIQRGRGIRLRRSMWRQNKHPFWKWIREDFKNTPQIWLKFENLWNNFPLDSV